MDEELKIMQDAYDGVTTPVEETAEEPSQEVEPWSGVPSVVREQIEALTNRLAALDQLNEVLPVLNDRLSRTENNLKQAEKRVGAITNDLYNKKEKDPEEESFMNDFPEITEYVSRRLREVESKIPEIQAPQPEVTKEDLARVVEMAKLEMAYPEWQEMIAAPDYKAWLATQPDTIKKAATAGKTAKEAVSVLKAFETAKKNKQRLESAAETPKGPKARAVVTPEDMSDAEYMKHLQKKYWG